MGGKQSSESALIEKTLYDFIEELNIRNHSSETFLEFIGTNTNFLLFSDQNKNRFYSLFEPLSNPENMQFASIAFLFPSNLKCVALLFLTKSTPSRLSEHYLTLIKRLKHLNNQSTKNFLDDFLTKSDIEIFRQSLITYCRLISYNAIKAHLDTNSPKFSLEEAKVFHDHYYHLHLIEEYVDGLLEGFGRNKEENNFEPSKLEKFFELNYQKMQHANVRESLKALWLHKFSQLYISSVGNEGKIYTLDNLNESDKGSSINQLAICKSDKPEIISKPQEEFLAVKQVNEKSSYSISTQYEKKISQNFKLNEDIDILVKPSRELTFSSGTSNGVNSSSVQPEAHNYTPLPSISCLDKYESKKDLDPNNPAMLFDKNLFDNDNSSSINKIIDLTGDIHNNGNTDVKKNEFDNEIGLVSSSNVFDKQNISQNFKAECLRAINDIRVAHSVSPLVEDTVLSAKAQGWAERLSSLGFLLHSDCEWDGKPIGESIAKCDGIIAQPAEAFCSQWHSEISNYDFNELEKPGKFLYKAKNFTQIVWKGTKYAGFGIAFSAQGDTYVTVNYYPAGNNLNDFTKNVFPKC